MSNQQSFVFLKPDAVSRHLIGDIIKRFEDAGLTVEDIEMTTASDDIIAKHYPLDDRNYLLTLGHNDITGKSEEELDTIYQRSYRVVKSLQDYVKEGPIVKMIIGGKEDTIAKVRELVGKTDPAASPKGSIRGDLGNDSFAQADKEGRSVKNLIHASGNPEEAEVELKLWFGK